MTRRLKKRAIKALGGHHSVTFLDARCIRLRPWGPPLLDAFRANGSIMAKLVVALVQSFTVDGIVQPSYPVAMAVNLTDAARQILNANPVFKTTFASLWEHHALLGRETFSAALGEISEHLIAKMIGAERVRRATRGHDLRLLPNNELIEVKARSVANYKEGLQFNFSRGSAAAAAAYCLAWEIDEGDRLFRLQAVIKISVRDEMIGIWGRVGDPDYCARVTLRKLMRACVYPA